MKFVIKEFKATIHLPDELIERGYKPIRGAKYRPEKNEAFLVLRSPKENGMITIGLNFGAIANLETCKERLEQNLKLEKKYTPESEFHIYSEILSIWNGCFYSHMYKTSYQTNVSVRYLEHYKGKMWILFCLGGDFDTIEACIAALKHILDNTEIEIKD